MLPCHYSVEYVPWAVRAGLHQHQMLEYRIAPRYGFAEYEYSEAGFTTYSGALWLSAMDLGGW